MNYPDDPGLDHPTDQHTLWLSREVVRLQRELRTANQRLTLYDEGARTHSAAVEAVLTAAREHRQAALAAQAARDDNSQPSWNVFARLQLAAEQRLHAATAALDGQTRPSGRPRTANWSGKYEVLGDSDKP